MSAFLSVVGLLLSLAAIAMSIDSIRLIRRAERTRARTQKLRDSGQDPWQEVGPRIKA